MLIWGECLEEMAKLPDKSIDLCLTDPPYGTTACKWDTVIPFQPMWAELKRIVKDNGAICLFGSEPFSSYLRLSNIKMFKYDWVWDKVKPSGHLNAKKMPMQQCELIHIFGKARVSYYPQGLEYGEFDNNRPSRGQKRDTTYGKQASKIKVSKAKGYPRTLIQFSKTSDKIRQHPTQKPVTLLEYLVKTYTLEGETVLDFTMGSGSTGVACANLNREFIGIEKEKKYYDTSVERIEKAKAEYTKKRIEMRYKPKKDKKK